MFSAAGRKMAFVQLCCDFRFAGALLQEFRVDKMKIQPLIALPDARQPAAVVQRVELCRMRAVGS
jgi:hypothetical protein